MDKDLDIKNGTMFSDGMADYCSVSWDATGAGAQVTCCCQDCGCQNQVTVEWPELVALKYGMSPHVAFQNSGILRNPHTAVWSIDGSGSWRSQLGCGRCKRPWLPILLDSMQAEKLLQKGRSMGFINPNGERQISQHCAQVGQMMAQRGR